MDSAQEKLLHTEKGSSESVKAPQKPEAAKEVSKKASEVMNTHGGVESKEGQESAEFNLGNVSENAGEDQENAGVGAASKAYTADEIETIRAKLLAALPSQKVMVEQIRKKLYKEEKVLEKRMKKLQGRADRNAFELTILVRQLRKVREYFAVLAHATFEMIKHLWLKIVHGV